MDPSELQEEGFCLYPQGHSKASGVSGRSQVQAEGLYVPTMVDPGKVERPWPQVAQIGGGLITSSLELFGDDSISRMLDPYLTLYIKPYLVLRP